MSETPATCCLGGQKKAFYEKCAGHVKPLTPSSTAPFGFALAFAASCMPVAAETLKRAPSTHFHIILNSFW
jgi:hypothetical protein